MLCTDTAIPFSDLPEYILIMPLHLFFIRDNINMNIAITNMPISKDLFAWLPQMGSEFNPLFDIKADIISKEFALISCQHCDFLTHPPYFFEFRIIGR